MYKTVTPIEAKKMLDDDGYVYIDVRSPAEFEAGHPAGAVNIPVAFVEPGLGMVPNGEFVDVVAANYPPDARLVVGCKSGGRSARAADLLTSAGYSKVANMDGGFDGRFGPMANLLQEGWCAAGLPVESGTDGESAYAAMKARKA